MKLGISSYTYAWAIGVPGHRPSSPMTAADLLHKADELEVSVVQIADNLPLHKLPPGELGRLAGLATTLGIEIEVGTRDIRPEHLRRYLGLAQQFRSPFLRVVVDTADFRPPKAEVVALLKESLPLFAEAGITLALENHDRFTAAEFAAIVEIIDSPYLGICLDTVNSFGALEGPESVVETLAPWTVNLHVKDFTIRRAGHIMGFLVEGTPAGQGRLDLPWLLAKLKEYGRDPNAILELWTPPEPDLSTTIAKEEAWSRQSIDYLRPLIP